MTLQYALDLLKLKTTFSDNELKESYKKELKNWHPDIAIHHGISEEMSTRKTQELNLAYEFIKKNKNSIKYNQSNGRGYGTSNDNNQHEVKNYKKWDETKRKSKYNVIDEIDDFFINKDIVKSTYVKWMIYFDNSNDVLVRLKKSTEFVLFNNITKNLYTLILNAKSVGSSISYLFEHQYSSHQKSQILIELRKRGLI